MSGNQGEGVTKYLLVSWNEIGMQRVGGWVSLLRTDSSVRYGCGKDGLSHHLLMNRSLGVLFALGCHNISIKTVETDTACEGLTRGLTLLFLGRRPWCQLGAQHLAGRSGEAEQPNHPPSTSTPVARQLLTLLTLTLRAQTLVAPNFWHRATNTTNQC